MTFGDMSVKMNFLPDFQEYLRLKSLVTEKYIPFYAYWARKKHSDHNPSVTGFKNLPYTRRDLEAMAIILILL
jgi:hypothetical protein